MIRESKNYRLQERSALRGGNGAIPFYHAIEPGESFDKLTLCAILEIAPGCSIGEHPHNPDAEIYFILQGELQVEDNGFPHTLRVGDIMYTGNGENHCARNLTNETVRMLAVVIK